MKKLLFLVLGMGLSVSAAAYGQDEQQQFCAGFEEGYKSLAGEWVVVPVCPVAPVTPVGSTPFREGLKQGMGQAYQQGYNN